MVVSSLDLSRKLKEIFEDHCNLSMEQFTEIKTRFTYLMDYVQDLRNDPDAGTLADAENEAYELGTIFEFLFNTKELTLKEYNDLVNMANEMGDAARELAPREVVR